MYYLSVDGVDPNDSLMSRFQGNRPTVLPASKHSRRIKALGESLEFSVGEITFNKGKYAVVEGSCYEGPLAAAHYSFTLKFHESRWIIKSRRLKM